MLDLLRRWRRTRLESRAAAWVVRIDEDRDGNEIGLRRWIGQSDERLKAYNLAYRAFHGASSAAQQIYTRQARSVPDSDSRNPRGGARHILAIAFSLFLASAALYFILSRLDVFERSKADRGATEQIATRIGEVRPIRLADGSRLLLDTDSEIRIDFSASARKVTMVRGRARFQVADDRKRPFSVTVDGATIIDRGTVFDVEAYRYVRVRLISGAIDLAFRPSAAAGPAPRLHLTAGQQVRFDPTLTSPTTMPTATPQSDTQWVSGMKTFDDVPVSDILEEANRYSTSRIILADPSIGSHRVFLDLDLRNTRTVAENLAVYLRLTVDTSVPGEYLLRSPDPASEKISNRS